jgi:hypothetical protein
MIQRSYSHCRLPRLINMRSNQSQLKLHKINQLQKRVWIASYIKALTTSCKSLVKNNVFIFISSSESALDGRIISLDPSSCMVADVLTQHGAAAEKDIIDHVSHGSIVLYRNGVRVALDDELCNGDVLTLPPRL